MGAIERPFLKAALLGTPELERCPPGSTALASLDDGSLPENLVPVTDRPLRDDLIEDERIFSNEFLGGLATGKDSERAVGGVHQWAGHQQNAASVEIVEPGAVCRVMESCFFESVCGSFVDHDEFHDASSSSGLSGGQTS
jgi:hypothetical protein